MITVPDLAMIVNLLLCIAILSLGYLVYRRRGSINALFIGIAFGMFGFSHLSLLVGLTVFPATTFVLMRICGYGLVIAALFRSLAAQPC
jgi:hypothetical protein